MSEKINLISNLIFDGSTVCINAKNYTNLQLMKFAEKVGLFKGNIILNNFNYLSDIELNRLTNLSKHKIIFQEECTQETKL